MLLYQFPVDVMIELKINIKVNLRIILIYIKTYLKIVKIAVTKLSCNKNA